MENRALKQVEDERSVKNESGIEPLIQFIGRSNFALFKGYLEGLDLKALGDRYLASSEEQNVPLAKTKQAIAYLTKEFLNLAKRQEVAHNPKILRIPPERLTSGGAATNHDISIDQFREERDPDGFYSESELLELFTSEYPSTNQGDRKAKRNESLRLRQLEVLTALGSIVRPDPLPNDKIEGWFAHKYSRRLNDHGIHTLAELVSFINNKGNRWYMPIKQFSSVAAETVIAWLLSLNHREGFALLPQVLAKRSSFNKDELLRARTKACTVSPLEAYESPPGLSGATGPYRSEAHILGDTVLNDLDAILLYLKSKQAKVTNESAFQEKKHAENGDATYRAYRKELERALMFANLELDKPFSAMTLEDVDAYETFLSDLGRIPDDVWNQKYKLTIQQWAGPKATERFSLEWRPFTQLAEPVLPPDVPREKAADWLMQMKKSPAHLQGILTSKSIDYALSAVNAFAAFLVENGYMTINPWKRLVQTRRSKQTKTNPSLRSFDIATLVHVNAAIQEKLNSCGAAEAEKYARVRFILHYVFATGLRRSEATGARISDIRRERGADSTITKSVLVVQGKGDTWREVPLDDQFFAELERYMAARGLLPWELHKNEYIIERLSRGLKTGTEQPTVESFDRTKGITADMLNKILQDFFEEVAVALSKVEPDMAERLRSASAHWLRHTAGTRAANEGVPLTVIQAIFGHSDPKTTMRYVTVDDKVKQATWGSFHQSNQAQVDENLESARRKMYGQ